MRPFILFAAFSMVIIMAGCAVEEIDGPTVIKELVGTESLVTVAGRKGATQRYLLIPNKKPRASVVLFAGDTGYLKIDDFGVLYRMSGNFLIKKRYEFLSNGMNVALIDTPSDRSSLDNFRYGLAHALDIKAVIASLRKIADVPVWLVGTSRGTISVTNAAGRLSKGGPDGIVLTSTVFISGRRASVYQTDLKSIRAPVLVVHHRKDGCVSTPYSGVSRFMKSISGAKKTKLITIEGGVGNIGGVCGPKSHHGFLGQEDEVVKRITDWIKAN